MIISISGSVGTGKTTVSKLLGKKLNLKVIDLNQFAKDNNLISGHDKKRDVDIIDVKKIDQKIQKLDNVIIESHYAHDIRSDLNIILRTNPTELRKRLEKRGWKKDKIEENVLTEIMEIILSEALESDKKTIIIDTTNKNPEQVVEEIEKKL